MNAADLLRRAGLADGGRPAARIVVVGAGTPADAAAAAGATPVDSLPWHEDVFASAALLAALVDRRAVHGAREAAPGLVALAERLHASRYTVIVWDAAALPAQGALVIEALQRVIATLNRTTRAAAFPIGLGAPAATANQVHAWLSGLPLRTRVGPRGLEHEPLCFDAARLLAGGAVDALLWVASFGLTPGLPALPASARLPRVVLAHPAFDAGDESDGAVFIPVSTPGVGTPGHLFRTDGVVLLPLHPIDPDATDPLPTVADVAARIERKLLEMAR